MWIFVIEGLSKASFTWKDLSEAIQRTRGLFKESYTVPSINGPHLYSSWTDTTVQATQNSKTVSMLHDKDCFAEKSVPVVFNIEDRKPTEELKLSSQ
jgi:hypothetical protein